jgi:hypothetical protein
MARAINRTRELTMAEQRTFAGLAWSSKGKITRRERFLAEMDAVIPFHDLAGASARSAPALTQPVM